MTQVDCNDFVGALAAADVIVCVSPDNSFVVLPPGEDVMRKATERAALHYFVVRVANDAQADMLAGGRMAITEGSMTSARAKVIWDLLASVADVPVAVH